MTAKEPRVKLKRLFLLFGIVNAGIAILALLAMAFVMALPTLNAIVWHIRNGNRFVLEGHSFHVPLTWNCTLDHYKEWALTKDHPLGGGYSSISLSSTGQVVDAEAIQRSIALQISSLKKYPSTFATSTEMIQGKKLTFLCMRMDMHQVGETLFCHVPNTDISVSTSASARYRAATRSILETSD